MNNPLLIQPDWPAPAHIKACCSTRIGGCSSAPYDSLNLGDHVADNPQNVAKNRQLLAQVAQLPAAPVWLQQTHSTVVVDAATVAAGVNADASFSTDKAQVCAVMTADCLPVLLTNQQGSVVAAIHAGWRGLADGIIEATVEKLRVQSPDSQWMAWLGPAISQSAFEVGSEVREYFLEKETGCACAFIPSENEGRWMADIYTLARRRLAHIGIEDIYGGDFCTYSNPTCFFSYRRDGQFTGRMASLIWIEPSVRALEI
ncbi:peptidoglycan editing factor PgeF [Pelagibaculum spongiae]|uniref:Purine nucleoside phosphorylase n=1 Tax=Pelagibaculum spongiae TaxID=2080658 RepID=A0A2V1H1B1_9GAMM|nr:peptidoglycan editing factor PgeF [Pelagibaculum spongiae]PVZ72469.1 peptidoglycan editing factor PgeF [Pelagibaculum spongiae]